jgi:hypothetical protein
MKRIALALLVVGIEACGGSPTYSVSQAASTAQDAGDADLCTLPDYGAPSCHTVKTDESDAGCGTPLAGALICCCP